MICIQIVNTIEIYPDDLTRGITQMNFSNAIIHDTNKNIIYSFDLTSVRKIILNNRYTMIHCNSSLQRMLDIELEKNLNWTQYRPEPISNSNVTKRISQTFDFNRALAEYLESPVKSTECNRLEQLIQEFAITNSQLNQLAKSNLSTINEIISLQSIVLDIYDSIDESHVLPFALSEYNIEKFFRTSNFRFFQDNYTVSLSFEIQLYSKTMINTINFLPVLKKNLPYVLNSNKTFIANLNGNNIYYSKQSLNILCDLRDSIFHCIRPIKDWDCEEKMIRGERVPKACLRKLKRKNIITRIDKNIHLLLFETIVFRISCGTDTPYFIKISNHSIIDNDRDCTIDNSYYLYDPGNTSDRYELLETDIPHIFDPDFLQTETINMMDFYLTICYLISLTVAYVMFSIITIMCTNKAILLEARCDTISVTSHEYKEPEDYYSTIP